MVIVPVDSTEEPLQRFQLVVLDKSIRKDSMVSGKNHPTAGELDGKEFQFRTPDRPALRFLYFKFLMSMLCHQHIVLKGPDPPYENLETQSVCIPSGSIQIDMANLLFLYRQPSLQPRLSTFFVNRCQV